MKAIKPPGFDLQMTKSRYFKSTERRNWIRDSISSPVKDAKIVSSRAKFKMHQQTLVNKSIIFAILHVMML